MPNISARLLEIALGLTIFAASPAIATTTYVYFGPKFQFIGGSGFTSSMSINGLFTTASPLPANMPLTDIGPAGNGKVTGWSFSDGTNTFDTTNSIVFGNQYAYFQVATDAAGNVSQFYITFMYPKPPHVLNQSMKFLNALDTSLQQSQVGIERSPSRQTSYGSEEIGGYSRPGDAFAARSGLGFGDRSLDVGTR